ncbi:MULTISPECIES: hypothetical protein [unclassified Curtobacterium]|uniref:hypothetical protein n=1 Tax=unclassified Curtobacterium TaxID=257496 RepID=UPI0038080AA1
MQNITDPTRTTRTARPLIALAAAALLLPGLLAACSAGEPERDATTAAGTAEKGSSLAACMRDKGYDMADPDSAEGEAKLGAPEGVDADVYMADLKECLGDGAVGSGEAAKPMAGSEERARAAAECIRAGGFPDFPDDDEGKAQYRPVDPDAFDDVARACDEQVATDAETAAP